MTSTKHPEATSNEAVTFKSLGISENVLTVLEKHSFIVPTPIQAQVIPLGVQGKDIIGIAQTGTGKTLGFGIPMVERLLANPDGRGLVVVPTRELASQVEETIRKIGGSLGLGTVVLIGGDPMYRQVRELRNGPSIVIATPGRLIDHLKQGNLTLARVSVVVLDEADHMFDIGFAPQIREIMKMVPENRQTLLFSATMPNEIAKLALEHMKLPLRIEVAPAGTASENVEQEIIVVSRPAKFDLLVKTLKEQPAGVPILVFTRTKHGAKDVALGLRNAGITASEIHSNRTLAQRREALDGFKKHKYQVLAATDIAARGIDVKDISLVVNYDLPEQSADYVHRIGRTGRAGKKGKAISFASPDQKYDITAIERLMKRTIPTKSHEGAVMGFSQGPRSFRGGYRGGGSRGGSRGGSSFGGSRGGSSSFGGGRPYTGARGGWTRGAGGVPVASGAFRVHTNQPFKGGAPRSASTSSAPASTSSSSYSRPSYSERSARPSYGGSRNLGAYGARSSSSSSALRSSYAPRSSSSSSYGPRSSSSYTGRSSGSRSASPRPAGPRTAGPRSTGFRSSGPRTGGAPFRRSR